SVYRELIVSRVPYALPDCEESVGARNFLYRVSQWPYGFPLTGSAQAWRRCSVALFAPTQGAGAAARYDARQWGRRPPVSEQPVHLPPSILRSSRAGAQAPARQPPDQPPQPIFT